MTHPNTHDRFLSAWWTVDLPSGWRGVEGVDCVSITRQPRFGVLQLSSARKPQGLVTEQDLKDFAGEHLIAGKSLLRVEFKVFSGFSIAYMKDLLFWREWWLRSGSLMIYATYNVKEGDEHIEKNDLNYILNSLDLRAT